jgi:hypothetical protein
MTTYMILTIFALALALVGASTAVAQEHQFATCGRDQTVSLQSVRVERHNPKSKAIVPVDTLVYPSDQALYVSVLVTGGSPKPGDSVYAITTFELLLRSSPAGKDSGSGLVVFPSKTVLDTVTALEREGHIVFGPIPAERLIPWPDRAVTATANANPEGLRARVAVIQARRRSGTACLASLEQGVANSPTVTLLYDP